MKMIEDFEYNYFTFHCDAACNNNGPDSCMGIHFHFAPESTGTTTAPILALTVKP